MCFISRQNDLRGLVVRQEAMRLLIMMTALWAIVIYVPPKVQATTKRPCKKAALVFPWVMERQPSEAPTTEVWIGRGFQAAASATNRLNMAREAAEIS